jgi:hypothetical protein
MIDRPGIFDLSDDEYFSDPCPEPSLSAGIAKTILRATPMHAADEHPRLQLADLPEDESEDVGKFDIGRAAHALLLGKGDPLVEVVSHTKDGEISNNKNTTAWKDGAAAARAAGQTPLLPAEMARVRFVVDRARAQLVDGLGFDPFADPVRHERSMIWKDGPVWCRGKADCLDMHTTTPTIWDLKTTAGLADPRPWATTQDRANFIALRAAHYLHGTRMLLGAGWRYRFVVVETRRPFALSVIELDGGWLDMGEDQRQTAVRFWQHCLAADEWRGWAKGVVTVDQPAWGEAHWVEDRDSRPTQAARDIAREAQRPVAI